MEINKLRKYATFLLILLVLISSINRSSISLSPFGLAAISMGLLIRFWASGYLRKKESLIIDGPYAFVRNPLYLGSFFIALGFLLLARVYIFIPLILIIFGFVYHRLILEEERELLMIFKEQYLEYCKHVPRFIPRLTPYRKNSFYPSKFNLKNVLKNKEYNTFFGVIGLLLLIYIMRKIVYR